VPQDLSTLASLHRPSIKVGLKAPDFVRELLQLRHVFSSYDCAIRVVSSRTAVERTWEAIS